MLEPLQREAERALEAKEYRRAHELCLQMLTQDPQRSDALLLLAVIAMEHGNFGKAAEVIERAIRIHPHRADYHAQLGRCFIALHQPRAALEVALEAFELNPSDALTLDTIGVVMTRAGAHAEALEPFRRAVERDPHKPSYQYNLGASLQFVGDFEGARRAYRAAVDLDPRYFRAWSALAQVSREPFDDADVAHLSSLLQSNIDPDAELHVCHALAKHYEDCEQHAAAFGYLERGKRRKRSAIRYSIDEDRALFDAARQTFHPQWLRAKTTGSSSAEPIFIIGMPRTGTTLVERILSSHPDVFSAGELSNFSLVVKRAARTPSNKVLDAETLIAGASVDPRKLGEEYVASTRPRTGRTPRFIDKMPLNFFYAGLIHRALPNARILCLRRNALDTCLSNFRQLFATGFSYYNYAYDLLDVGRYYLMFDELAAHWREHIPHNYCEVHYESVVADVEAEARRIVEFCGLNWHPACLDFHTNAAPVATASSVQVRQPIYRTAVERWRKYERELAPLRALLGV